MSKGSNMACVFAIILFVIAKFSGDILFTLVGYGFLITVPICASIEYLKEE